MIHLHICIFIAKLLLINYRLKKVGGVTSLLFFVIRSLIELIPAVSLTSTNAPNCTKWSTDKLYSS